MTSAYYIRFRGKVQGPYSVERLHTLAQRRRFGRHFEVSTDGAHWSPASEIPELFPQRSRTPIQRPAQPQRTIQADTASNGVAAREAHSETNAETYPLHPEPERSTYDLGAATQQPAFETPSDDIAAPNAHAWYYARDDRQYGPVTTEEVRELLASGELSADAFVWREGLDDWMEAVHVPDLIRPARRRSRSKQRRSGKRHATDEQSGSIVVLSVLCGVAVVLSLPFALVEGMNGGAVAIVATVFAYLLIAMGGLWRMFDKAGYSGWLSIMPIANLLVAHEIAGVPKWMLLLWLIPCINLIAIGMLYYGVARNFGQDFGFAIGLFFLTGIFFALLGFGDYEYEGTWSF